jgi:hypothetical protein
LRIETVPVDSAQGQIRGACRPPMVNFDFSTRFFRKGHYTVLLIALVLGLFLLPPIVLGHPWLSLLLRGALTFVFFAACYAIATSQRALWATVALAVLAATMGWMSEFVSHPIVGGLASVLGAVFFLWSALLLLKHVLGEGSVTLDRLFGAICIYLLLALAWAEVFAFIYQIDPNSFAISEALRNTIEGNPDDEARNMFVYYSFVTLTTVGYGDVSPLGVGARSAAALEMVVGPLYLAILIARLVSLMDLRNQKRDS